jgi:hypothetical protein
MYDFDGAAADPIEYLVRIMGEEFHSDIGIVGSMSAVGLLPEL